MPTDDQLAARRADIDAKQQLVAGILAEMNCEAAVLLVPAHVAWFTSGLVARGLIAETERPGVYTNGRQRWLLCSSVDSQRLFDEEIDQLGFQLKEWAWPSGRADLLMNVCSGRAVVADRPFPNMPQIAERLRPLVRTLSAFEQDAYRELGLWVAHAVEATARALRHGDPEEEIAGQLGHRLLHHGIKPATLSVMADGRGAKYRRAAFTPARVERFCTLQATGQRAGLFVTVARTVAFEVPDELRAAHALAAKLSAVYRSFSVPGAMLTEATEANSIVLAATPFEFEDRLSQPGYGTGRFTAEELRRAGHDEALLEGQAVVWQPRVGSAACADTVLVTATGPEVVTPPVEWPFKRIIVRGITSDVPDILLKARE